MRFADYQQAINRFDLTNNQTRFTTEKSLHTTAQVVLLSP